MILEVVKHYPAYPLDKALETESLVIARLYSELPDIAHRQAWPFMQLQAFIGNALGGKSKGGERPDPGTVWHPDDLAPGYQPRPLGGLGGPVLGPQHCWAFMEALEAGHLEGCSWAVQMVELEDSLERVQAVGEGYGELLSGELQGLDCV